MAGGKAGIAYYDGRGDAPVVSPRENYPRSASIMSAKQFLCVAVITVLASTCCAYIGSVHLTSHVVKPRPCVDAASTTSRALIFCVNCVCRLCWCTEIARVWRRSTVRVINTDSFHLAILLRWLRCCVYCKFLRTSSRCHKCSSAHVSTQTHCPMQK